MLGVSEQNQAGHPTLGWVFSVSCTKRSILSISVNTVSKSNFTPNLSHLGDIIRCISVQWYTILFQKLESAPHVSLSEFPCVHCFIDESSFSYEWLPSDCTAVKTLRCRDFIYSPQQHNCSLSLKKQHWLHHHTGPGQCTAQGCLSREKSL